MAENDEEKKNQEGPKDTTPNPMDEAEKKAAESGKGEKETPAEAGGEKSAEPKDETPEKASDDIKNTVKSSFLDSRGWNRVAQLILLAAGAYGFFDAMSGEVFESFPGAVFGGLAFVLAALLELRYLKKFAKDPEKPLWISRWALLGITGLLFLFFIVEIFRPFSIELNKIFPAALFIAVVAVFTVDFILYISKNKKKIVADTYLFVSVITGALALLVFYLYMQVIAGFGIAFISLIFLVLSLARDPLKSDGRLGGRVTAAIVAMVFFLGILGYASTVFFTTKLPAISYGPITDKFKYKPKNLAWSGDNWSLAYNFYNKKKERGKLGIINALSLGITEFPPEKEKKGGMTELPRYIDRAVWNNDGSFLAFTGSDKEEGHRKIWGVSLNLSLLKTIDKTKGIEEGKRHLKKLRTKKEDKANMPVGRPKVLLADVGGIITDKKCDPLTHRTAWAPGGGKFVFAAHKRGKISAIYAADTKKQEVGELTRGAYNMYPLWSPAGDRILYVTKRDSYTYLKVSNYNGSNAHELNIDKRREDRELFPLWNAAQNRVIYIKDNKLVIMHANATNQRNLSRKSLPKSGYWLTDEKKKVKLKYTDSGTIWRVRTMNTKGKNHKTIFTEVCEEMTQPKWSYDGEAVVVGANYGDHSSLWRFGKDGELETRIYTTGHSISELEWAYSSERLAFIVKKPSVEELWAVNRDATKPLLLYEAHKDAAINHMSWDNEGDLIAFDESYRAWYFAPRVTSVKVVHAIGGTVYSLFPYEFYGEYPTWSSDGQVIAYVGWNRFWLPSMKERIWIYQVK